MVQINGYLEGKRYVENARKILSSSAGKEGEYYTDPKYVKMACSTAYTGVLVALADALKLKPGKTSRLDVDVYRKAIGSQSKKMLQHFNSAYQHLHLWGGYDGNLNVKTTAEGLRLAEELLKWTEDKVQ